MSSSGFTRFARTPGPDAARHRLRGAGGARCILIVALLSSLGGPAVAHHGDGPQDGLDVGWRYGRTPTYQAETTLESSADRGVAHLHRYRHSHWHTHVLADGTVINHQHPHEHEYWHIGVDATDHEKSTRLADQGERVIRPAETEALPGE